MAEPASQLDDMAHFHPVDEDVDLPTVHAVKVEQALVPVQGVESLIALVAERLEEFLHGPLLLRGGDEVEIAIPALERCLPGARRMKVDGRAPNQLDRNPGLLRRRRDPLRLSEDVIDGDACASGQLRPPARRR